MGRPSGPDFAGPSLPVSGPRGPGSLGSFGPAESGWTPDRPMTERPASEPPRPASPRPSPPRNRLPAVLTAVALVVVGLVVVLASVWAGRQDAREAVPQPAPLPSQPVSATPSAANQIEFTGDSGSGVLQIVRHSWDPAGATAGGRSLLTLEITVRCISGTLRYGPDSFEAFDQDGGLFESRYDPDSSNALELIRLSAGEQVSGTVTFEIPRGDVTLLLSDDLSRPVTALKVPE